MAVKLEYLTMLLDTSGGKRYTKEVIIKRISSSSRHQSNKLVLFKSISLKLVASFKVILLYLLAILVKHCKYNPNILSVHFFSYLIILGDFFMNFALFFLTDNFFLPYYFENLGDSMASIVDAVKIFFFVSH